MLRFQPSWLAHLAFTPWPALVHQDWMILCCARFAGKETPPASIRVRKIEETAALCGWAAQPCCSSRIGDEYQRPFDKIPLQIWPQDPSLQFLIRLINGREAQDVSVCMTAGVQGPKQLDFQLALVSILAYQHQEGF